MYQYYRFDPNQNRFLGPFILGGITGGLISPLFWQGYKPNQNYFYPYPYYPYPYYRKSL